MGYTHYWAPKPIEPDRWALIVTDARKLVAAMKAQGTPLLLYSDDPASEPQIDDEEIYFNGAGGDGHETFVLTRDSTEWVFCKTAKKPYDRAVCAILACAKRHAPDDIEVSSDGAAKDWQPHLDWASEVLGEPVALPLGEKAV